MDGDLGQIQTDYRVLARKYRPSTFDDLIGQEPMVRTLTNAFRLDRIAQAYMLTGVRGVGKTTTARILARALNYEKDGIDRPTIEMPDYGAHCEAIIESSHIDVIEMDAASHTGINDIREIIDAVKYKPASARYKVYIIDEVHMLSTAAFNGLLKTLEEPPEHVKFIFATTEIRKVPVTVLSRCQRFDLRRIEGETMVSFLNGVCEKENVEVDPDALSLITRAGEGSVRDCLSLLDQAIAHGSGAVKADPVRDMLGLADRARVIDLFEHVLAGRVKEALFELREQYDAGADPLVILSDLAEFTHLVTTAKLADGLPSAYALSDLEKTKAEDFANKLTVRVLSRNWQLLLKGIEEVQGARRPLAAAEMVLIRMAYIADLPDPEDILKSAKEAGVDTHSASRGSFDGSGGGASSMAVAARSEPLVSSNLQASDEPKASLNRPVLATNNPEPIARDAEPQQRPQPVLSIARFEDLIALAEEKRSLTLRSALQNNVRLISFEDGRMEFALSANTSPGFPAELKSALKNWTGRQWSVVVAREGGMEPLADRQAQENQRRTQEAEDDPVVAAVLKQFPGSKIVNVTFRNEMEDDDILEPAPDDEDDDN